MNCEFRKSGFDPITDRPLGLCTIAMKALKLFCIKAIVGLQKIVIC